MPWRVPWSPYRPDRPAWQRNQVTVFEQHVRVGHGGEGMLRLILHRELGRDVSRHAAVPQPGQVTLGSFGTLPAQRGERVPLRWMHRDPCAGGISQPGREPMVITMDMRDNDP